MPAVARLMLEIAGDSTKAVAALKKTGDAASTAESSTKKTGASITGIAKAVATGYAVAKVVDFGRTSVKAAEESAVAHERLVSTFKGAGDATGAAAAGAEAYAQSLSKATGVDDEAIMGAQSLLATFHSVSGAAGRQAGIFNRATAAAADLAAAGFGDLNSNAVQLGKALEDPTKGITALARSGVTFTKAQKDQIAALQKSGDVLGAQKIVLAGVEGQVKGTAAATATESAKMAVAWGNFQETVGAALLPFIDTITSKLTGLFTFVSANSSWLVPLVGGIAAIVAGLVIFAKTVEIVKTAIAGFRIAWLLLNSSFLASPLGLIIAGVVALIAVIVIIATKTNWFQNIWKALTSFMSAAWRATVGAITSAWNAAYGLIAGVFRGIQSVAMSVWGWIRSNWPLLLGVLTGPFGLAIALVYTFRSQILGALSSLVGAIGGIFSSVVGAITGPFRTAFAIVKGIVDGALGAIRGAVSSVMSFVSFGIGLAKGVYNSFARGWNAVQATMPSVDTHIPGIGKIGGFTIGLPDLPMLARGAYLRVPTLAVVGEAGGEYVLPEARLAALVASAGGGRGGATVTIEKVELKESVDVEVFARRLAWSLQVQRV
jgi:hypothetical protein